MQELMEEQQMSAEEAASHPSARALTRAVGANDELMLDVVDFTVYPGDHPAAMQRRALPRTSAKTAIGGRPGIGHH